LDLLVLWFLCFRWDLKLLLIRLFRYCPLVLNFPYFPSDPRLPLIQLFRYYLSDLILPWNRYFLLFRLVLKLRLFQFLRLLLLLKHRLLPLHHSVRRFLSCLLSLSLLWDLMRLSLRYFPCFPWALKLRYFPCFP
jgi:hypothetical protein